MFWAAVEKHWCSLTAASWQVHLLFLEMEIIFWIIAHVFSFPSSIWCEWILWSCCTFVLPENWRFSCFVAHKRISGQTNTFPLEISNIDKHFGRTTTAVFVYPNCASYCYCVYYDKFIFIYPRWKTSVPLLTKVFGCFFKTFSLGIDSTTFVQVALLSISTRYELEDSVLKFMAFIPPSLKACHPLKFIGGKEV